MSEEITEINFPIYDEQYDEINNGLKNKTLIMVAKEKSILTRSNFYLLQESISKLYQLIIITGKFVSISYLLTEDLDALRKLFINQIGENPK